MNTRQKIDELKLRDDFIHVQRLACRGYDYSQDMPPVHVLVGWKGATGVTACNRIIEYFDTNTVNKFTKTHLPEFDERCKRCQSVLGDIGYRKAIEEHDAWWASRIAEMNEEKAKRLASHDEAARKRLGTVMAFLQDMKNGGTVRIQKNHDHAVVKWNGLEFEVQLLD